ncbi:GTP pyrophosphokinase/guanosine-3',5'-bis(diphosphate) 3'-pyrophosphohydrolase [Thiogranum longum]|uniref:guanosine-3',5'-bis(diphosphate) 3'-diphosphatase n=1 Tax=Thiogranum longum TaxID=1537524 RepID=A0A4R1HIK7_9GAMM|nr:bifunctional GTP diphosphokinase/guanosine-3',5'-bis pyrophosphate 3'-pyrophosphohydrolase [Thiogranum longum]TCK17042.1 GTP pyrophosphokinase/guanosine-3',5'-bis(diphosphate) 3'-pyrophosphohydrolase [Thiogranum longum]
MASTLTKPVPDAQRFLISDLCDLLETYLDKEQVSEVYRAYLIGAEAHEGQHRKSGEPYIYHPVAVARILAEMHMDPQSIIAAILHDVIEDTAIAKETIEKEFGEEVAELVDGVSKLTQIKFESQAEAQAENFRKMMLAMVRDIRVILVKLADRLHNMRTLGVMRADKRRRIARETLEIYAPIANRLGMNQIRLELEELGMAALYPMRYRVLSDVVKKARGNRKEILNKIESAIQQRLDEEKLHCRLQSREKHVYSLYKKIRDRVGSFNEVFDVYAFRIIVDSVDTCYRVLGMMHNLYKPVPGKFKDYIAIPKANGYQSLHTVLFGPYGVPVEVQIRTEDMERVAESGIAAHWLYKSSESSVGANNAQTRAREWLRELLEMQRNAGNSLEFLENVKIDLFPDEVYVFTPAGDILNLKRGATAVDFAYAVHTDVGNTCIAAKIDRRLAPLRTPLLNGQTVEVITAAGAHPNPAWLNFVATAKARSNIRHYLKNLQNDEAAQLGKRMLDKALQGLGSSLQDIPGPELSQVTEEFGFESCDALCADIGLGNRAAMLVARRLVPAEEGAEVPVPDDKHSRPLAIRGTEGMVVHFARCCRPIPGDNIIGFISAGRGLVIHTETCNNLTDYRSRPDKWIDVEWQPGIEGEFPVEVRVDVSNQKGVLATIAAEISELESNIENVSIEERDGLDTALDFTLTVRDRQHLARVMRGIRKLPAVMRITRTKH